MADQRDQPLRAQPGHGCRPLEGVAGARSDLGPERVLTVQDVSRDVLGELLDEQLLAHHDLVDRLLEQLREARHMDALLLGIEVDVAVDRGGNERLVAVVAHSYRLLDVRHARAREAEPHFGRRRLEVVPEGHRLPHGPNAS